MRIAKFILLFLVALLVSCTPKPEPTISPISPLPRGAPGGPESISPGEHSATVTPDPLASPLVISEVMRRKDDLEIIVIANISAFDQNLAGMSLLEPESMRYLFLPEVVLPPGDTIRVCNGNCGTGDGIQWLKEPVLYEPGDQLILLNQAGRVIWNYVNFTGLHSAP